MIRQIIMGRLTFVQKRPKSPIKGPVNFSPPADRPRVRTGAPLNDHAVGGAQSLPTDLLSRRCILTVTKNTKA